MVKSTITDIIVIYLGKVRMLQNSILQTLVERKI